MGNQAAETVIGALVLIVAGAFLLYANQTAGVTGGSGRYELFARFNSVDGINVGTDVRLAGIKVGSVTGMTLNPETYQAEVRIAIDEAVRLPSDSDVAIATEGLLGGSFVSVSPGGSDFMLTDGEEIELTQSAISVINLLMRFATGGDE